RESPPGIIRKLRSIERRKQSSRANRRARGVGRGETRQGFLDRFMELETLVPAIVTTSQMMTTGVDVPTCKNVVLERVINSMTDFKQIIGRGTRVRDDYGKPYSNLFYYTAASTRLSAAPYLDVQP